MTGSCVRDAPVIAPSATESLPRLLDGGLPHAMKWRSDEDGAPLYTASEKAPEEVFRDCLRPNGGDLISPDRPCLSRSRGHRLVLIVQPSYTKRWHLPGGYVHVDETPIRAVACEVHEELGIEPELKGPAVIAWEPHGGAERLLFSYIGRLTAGQRER